MTVETKTEMIADIVEMMTCDIQTQPDSFKRRGQHPKQHGCLYGIFSVEDSVLNAIPETYRERLKVGILSHFKDYPTWIRFSNLRQTDDSKGDVHGMALKLMEVDGAQLSESESELESGGHTQDLTLIDAPIFFMKDVKGYRDFFRAVDSLKTVARMKPRLFNLKDHFSRLKALGRTIYYVLSFVLPSIWPKTWQFKSIFLLIKNVLGKKRNKAQTLLSETFWSPTAMRWGDLTVKVMLKPWEMNQMGFADLPSDLSSMASPHYLRDRIKAHLTVARKPAAFDVYLQIPRDDRDVANDSVADDPTVTWKDPQVFKVATLRIPPQAFDTQDQELFSEQLSFSPWHGLKVHEPVGDINLIRLEVYKQTSKLRNKLNDGSLRTRGWGGVAEPTPSTWRPNLLAPASGKPADLNVLVPIIPEQLERLKSCLQQVSDAMAADPGSYFGRSPRTHFARWVIFEDDDIQIPPQLLFTSNYDGSLELYLEELLQVMNPEMTSIWSCCQTFSPEAGLSLEQFKTFIQQYQLPSAAFYVGCPGLSLAEIKNNQQVRINLEQALERETLREMLTQGLSEDTIFPGTPRNRIPPLLQKFTGIARQLSRVLWSLIGIKPQPNDPTYREDLTPLVQQRMVDCDAMEDPVNLVQNQLTTLSIIKSDFHLFMLRNFLKLIQFVASLGRGQLSGIATIHFARWVIVEKGIIDHRAFLIFESNYGGSWDSYLDDFIYLTLTAMNSLWGNLDKFPITGCQDVETFKTHQKTRQFPTQVFYRAYPTLSVRNILIDQRLAKGYGHFLQGNLDELIRVYDHPLTNFVKAVNRMA